MGKKYYVVWHGRQTGVFDDWNTVKKYVDGVSGARYKAFPTREDAEQAFNSEAPASASPAQTAQGKNTAQAAQSDRNVQIYCDGACEPNPGEAGSGIAVYRDGKLTGLWYGLYNPDGTNNTAELQALHHALLMAEQALAAGDRPEVLSDSKYSIDCIATWAPGWRAKGWRKDGGPIRNLGIIKAACEVYERIKGQVKLTHVRGHVGVEGNELVDRMAMLAVQEGAVDLRQYPHPIDVPTILRLRAG